MTVSQRLTKWDPGSVGPLAIFAVVFTALCVSSYTKQSATWDEPHHVATGVLAWQGDYRIDPEHPPFLRLWSALPLTLMAGIKDQREMLDKISPEDWISVGQFQYSHAFMYLMNDADSLLYRARFMVVLLGVLLGCLLFCWVREWLGLWPAVAALTLYCFEPNILANSAIVTTDLAVTCFIFGALYFLWRTTRRLSAGNMAGLTAFVVLAVISKFSAIILVPIVAALLAIHVLREGPWAGRTTLQAKAGIAGGIVVWLVLISWAAVWAIYGFRFAPSTTAGWFYHFQDDPSVVARAVGARSAWSPGRTSTACCRMPFRRDSSSARRRDRCAVPFSREPWAGPDGGTTSRTPSRSRHRSWCSRCWRRGS